MTCQTQSASTHAETPAAEAPEPAEAPSTTKVDQSPSTTHPSTLQPSTVQQSSTSQPTTTPPTDSPSQTDVPPEPMSQSRAMKRPLEQIPQPELKRMSLGEDPSVEHGILAARRFALVAKTTITRGTVPADVLESRYSRRERAGASTLRTG